MFCADTHLRVSQYARTSRGEDFSEALMNVFRLAVEEKISTICISGDLLDSTRPSPKIITFLKQLDAAACRHGVQIIVISGNHDFTEPHWATVAGVSDSQGPCGLKIIDNQLVTLSSGLTIYGQPYVNKDRFIQLCAELPKADVLLFHGMVQELANFNSNSALSLTDLPSDKYKVIAIGDVHICKQARVGPCLIIQPGSTELCSTSEDENKTVTVLTFDAANRVVGEPALLPIKTRQVLRFKLTTEEDLEQALLQAETQQANDPIVVVEYAVSLTDVQQRFSARLDSTKAILRFFPSFRSPKLMNMGADVREDLPLSAFLDKLIPSGTPLHQLATSLLIPEANTVELVDRYIEERRQALVTA